MKYLPIILLVLYLAAMWFFSLWRLRQELNQKSTPLNHPRLVPMLERLGRAMDLPPVRAHVYEVDPVNGLAAPDGRIFLTRGFIRKLDAGEVTPEELASVIAHELGHVAHGHARRRMIDFAGQNAIRMALAGILGRIIPGLGAWIAGLIATAVAAVKMGATDYLAKPADANDVTSALLSSRESLPPPSDNPMSADRVRWEHIQRVYEQCDRNVSETARRLHMHRRTLQRILAKRGPR